MKSYMYTLLIILILSASIFSYPAKADMGTSQLNGYILNKGQWPDSVYALHKGGGLNTWITRNGWVYDVYKEDSLSRTGAVVFVQLVFNESPLVTKHVSNAIPFSIVSFVGDATQHSVQYSSSITRVFANGFVIVDTTNGNSSRYDIKADRAATVQMLRLVPINTQVEYSLAQRNIILRTPNGSITQSGLHSYQLLDNGQADFVRSSFNVKNKSIGFTLEGIKAESAVVIDPIVYSTYVGQGVPIFPNDTDILPNGDVVVVGAIGSNINVPFPTSQGAYQTSAGGDVDGFVAVFDSTLSRIKYATFVGGKGNDGFISVNLKVNGKIVAVGKAGDATFPTTPTAFQKNFGGGIYDACIVVLSTDCSRLEYSSLTGSIGRDYFLNMFIDSDSTAIIVGRSENGGFPSIQRSNIGSGGSLDAGIMQLSTKTWQPIKSFTIGGTGSDEMWDGFTDNLGRLYFVGYSESADLTLLPNGYQASKKGSFDGFILRFNAGLQNLERSTWLGGAGIDAVVSIAQGKDGSIYTAGNCYLGDVQLPPEAFQRDSGGGGDLLISKFDADLLQLQAATYLGGSKSDFPQIGKSLRIHPTGNIVVKGFTASTNFPLSTPTYRDSLIGGNDLFISMLTPKLDTLLYSTLIGGSDAEGWHYFAVSGGFNIRADSTVMFATSTSSTDFPTSDSAVFPEPRSGGNLGIVFNFGLNALRIHQPVERDTVCDGDSIEVLWTYAGTKEAKVAITFVDDRKNVAVLIPEVNATTGRAIVRMPLTGTTRTRLYTIQARVLGTGGDVVNRVLLVLPKTTITSVPQSIVRCTNTNLVFELEFSGEVNSIQWYRNGQPLPNEISSSYSLPSSAPSGVFSAKIIGRCNADSLLVADVKDYSATVVAYPDTLFIPTQKNGTDNVNFVFKDGAFDSMQVKTVVSNLPGVRVVSTTPSLPSTLAKGDTVRVLLEYDSLPEQAEGTLTFKSDSPCSLDKLLLIKVSKNANAVVLSVQNERLLVSPPQQGFITITSVPSLQSLKTLGLTNISMVVAYSSLHLFPVDYATTNPSLASSFVLNCVLDTLQNNFIQIPVLPLLGPDSTTKVDISQTTFSGLQLHVTTVPGTFILDGFCVEGGLRSVFSSSTTLLTIVPNPANRTIIATASQATIGREFRIVNVVGKLLIVGTLGQSVDVSFLPRGIYSVVTDFSLPQLLVIE